MKNENNTIRLLKNSAVLNSSEIKKFNRGQLIFGENENPEEIQRWDVKDKDRALEELKKYECKYERDANGLYYISEYALETFQADPDGEFLVGADYDLAECADYTNDMQPKFQTKKVIDKTENITCENKAIDKNI